MADHDHLQAHRLHINDRWYETLMHHSETLLSVLRERLDLIGTKQGCDKGDCGACTVLVDKMPILSCISLAKSIDECQSITTIEGLLQNGELDIIVKSFHKTGALQCGFCQPGMILSAKALLENNIHPTLLDIKEALSGNLCRCTGYSKIYLAVFCASLVLNQKARDLDHALTIMQQNPQHLGEA